MDKKHYEFTKPVWANDDQKKRFEDAVAKWHEEFWEVTINPELIDIVASSFIDAEEISQEPFSANVIGKVLSQAVISAVDTDNQISRLLKMLHGIGIENNIQIIKIK
jgi:hypothetical protein